MTILYILEGLAILLLVSYLFYNHWWAAFFISPWVYLYVRDRKKSYAEKQKRKMSLSFKDGMQSLSNSLTAGYSLENALKEAVAELKLLHGEKDTTAAAFQKILNHREVNRPLEEGFAEFAANTPIEEVSYFAQVLKEAHRSGGNLIQIMRNTAEMISDRMEVNDEILTITTAKRFEQNIMNVIPIAIILYMRLTSPSMMNQLYDNWLGIGVMTGCLVLYFAGIKWAEHIINISM